MYSILSYYYYNKFNFPSITPSSVPSQTPSVVASLDIITTIAGSGGTGSYSGDDGAATSAALYGPHGVALDASGTTITTIRDNVCHRVFCALADSFLIPNIGNVYIADYLNQRVRKVTVSTGIITTIAGSGGTGGYSGDNGQATSATLYYPSGVAVDSSGRITAILLSLSVALFSTKYFVQLLILFLIIAN